MSLPPPSGATVVAVEGRKAASSRVLLTTGVLLVAGVGILAGVMTAAARGGNEQIRAQLAGFADSTRGHSSSAPLPKSPRPVGSWPLGLP
jgi:ABC-2 type transport system permease protein